MKLAALLLLALPIWSQDPLQPGGERGISGIPGANGRDPALLAQAQAQAVPAPPAPVLPADVLKAVVSALVSPPLTTGTGELPDNVLKKLQGILAVHPELISYIPSGICGITAICDKGIGGAPGTIGLPPTPAPAAAIVEPSQVLGVGFGIQGLGPAQFQGGDFIAQHIATNTYTIEATDFARLPGGGVGTSAMAGVLNILHRFGPVYIGVVGTAGAAEGATGSASGALSGWGVLGSTFGSKPLGIALAAQTTKVAGAPGPTGQFKLYLTFAWFK